MQEPLLQGYRVLDLSQYLPGPYATRILADLGAEVVKVEPPAGDPMRSFMYADADGISPLYKQINAGKSVLRLDLKDAADRADFSRLVAAADVLLESYRPGVLERLGFGRERLQQLNPRLVHCALSGFGQNGPAHLRAGHDLTYVALSGMLHHTGTAAEPVMPFPPVSDYAGGQQAATAILAALLRRERSGVGTFIDASLFESILAWQSFALAALELGELVARGRGLLTGGAACYQIYPTADGRFVVLGAIEEKFWQAFCRSVERPQWLDRQHEAMPQTALISEVRALFATAPQAHWCTRLAAVDCCFEALLEPSEVAELPQVRYRQLLAGRDGGSVPLDILFPAHIDTEPPARRRPLCEPALTTVVAAWEAKTHLLSAKEKQ